MTITLQAVNAARSHYTVIVTQPSAAIVQMAQRMADDESNMVSGYVKNDGTVELEARGARGGALYDWATRRIAAMRRPAAPVMTNPKAQTQQAAAPVTTRSRTVQTGGTQWCPSCHGPTSIAGTLCDHCSGDA